MKKTATKWEMFPVTEMDILKIFKYLTENNYIVILGVVKFILNTGKTVTEVLNLKFEDLVNSPFNSSCLLTANILKEYYKSNNIDNYDKGYLFKSFKQGLKNTDTPISYKGIHMYFKKLQEELDIKYLFNTHSLRKAWGKKAYEESGHNINLVMTVLEQKNILYTLKYIGEENTEFILNKDVSEADIIDIYKKVKF